MREKKYRFIRSEYVEYQLSITASKLFRSILAHRLAIELYITNPEGFDLEIDKIINIALCYVALFAKKVKLALFPRFTAPTLRTSPHANIKQMITGSMLNLNLLPRVDWVFFSACHFTCQVM
jgi:hypothetical protein